MSAGRALSFRAGPFGASPLPSVVVDLFRYGLVGAVALSARGVHDLVALAIAFTTATGYGLSPRFVFAHRRGRSRPQGAAASRGVGPAGLPLTQAPLSPVVPGLALDAALARIPTAGCAFAFNVLVRRGFVLGARPVAR